jgi:threonine/homoserine/homoserine lactone efflux protein
MTFASLTTYAFALFVVAVIPGPGIAALVARALGSGIAAGLGLAAGIVLGDVVFLTAAALGVAALAAAFGTVFIVIKYIGAIYLAWIAYKIWTAGLVGTDVEAGRRHGVAHSFYSGLLVTLGNPKAMLFYMALLPTLMDLRSLTLAGYGELVCLTAVVLAIVTIPYVLLAATARGFLHHPAAVQRLNHLSAGFLIIAAGYIALRPT